MRKKIGLILLQILLVIAIMIPTLRATTETVGGEEQNNVVEEVNTEIEDNANLQNDIMLIDNLPALQNEIFENIYYANEDVSRINEIIYGNVYIAGNNVKLENVRVEGDLFVVANTLKIDNTSTLNGNVYICAANAEIYSMLNKELFIVAKDLRVGKEAVVRYSANVCAEHFSFNGIVERELNVSADRFEIGEGAAIYRKLNYTSGQEAKIDENANIKDINFHKYVEEKETILDIIFDYFIDFANYFIVTMILMIILIKIAPIFVKEVKDYFRVSSFGTGILLLILLPILCVLLLLTNIASMLSIIIAMIAIAFAMISMSITNIAIAALISSKNEKIKLPISTAISVLGVWALMQIPFVGGIITFCLITTGIGIMFRYTFLKIKK